MAISINGKVVAMGKPGTYVPLERVWKEGDTIKFGLPATLHPLVMIATGRLGDYADVAPEIAERDSRTRHRLPLDDIVSPRLP